MITDSNIYFYDTCSLLLAGDQLFRNKDKFVISSITLKELERIKVSTNKDEDIKYRARTLLHQLEKYCDNYDVIIHQESNELEIKVKDLDITDDTKILSDAFFANELNPYCNKIIFVTNDLSLKNIASLFFSNDRIQSIKEENDNYTGYKEVSVDDDCLARFYGDITFNRFDLKNGEYLVLRNDQNEVVDLRAWDGEKYRYLDTKPFKSKWFGQIAPIDNYQKLAFDSLRNNTITMLRGAPGTGKTLLALGALMAKLENHDIDKILIFCNPVATINSAKLGYTPGSLIEKILDSQIGNILSSKLGDRCAVERLIQEGKLSLLPFSNLRGMDTTGMRAGVYITEAQNLDINLMKLALQRIGEGNICVIDGDDLSQVDMLAYSGKRNGMKRASKIFRGHGIYGEVKLVNIQRSEIAKLAEEM